MQQFRADVILLPVLRQALFVLHQAALATKVINTTHIL